MSKNKKAVAKLSTSYEQTCYLDQTELATLARLTNDAVASYSDWTEEEILLLSSNLCKGVSLDTLNMKIWNALHSLETEDHYARVSAAHSSPLNASYIDTLDVIIDKLEERS